MERIFNRPEGTQVICEASAERTGREVGHPIITRIGWGLSGTGKVRIEELRLFTVSGDGYDAPGIISRTISRSLPGSRQ